MTRLTIDDIRQAIDDIRRYSLWNPGAAHVLEDGLHVAALKAIAQGRADAAELAWEVLRAEDIDFARGYEPKQEGMYDPTLG